MVKATRLTTLALLAVLLLSAAAPAAAQEVYTLTHYEATFELSPNSTSQLRNVKVTLVITYDITSGPKSSGYKFVGTLPIQDVSVTDGAGKPLKFTTDKLTEYRVNWEFAPISRGQQTVIVHFTIVDALEGSPEKNRLYIEWVKNWKVSVADVTYRFILPPERTFNQVGMLPAGGKGTIYQDRLAAQVHLDTLPDQALLIELSPGVAQGRTQPAPSATPQTRASPSAWGQLVIFLLFAGILGWMIWGVLTGRIKSGGSSAGGCGGSGGCGGGGCGGGGCGGCGG